LARILVVDDEREVRVATRRILERSGHEVVEAGTGEEGIEVLETTAVDLVITDIMMPGQGGVESLAQMRELYSGLRVIAMSAHALDELPEAQRLGAARTIVKPFTVETLTRMVDEVLSGEDPDDDPLTNFNVGFLEEIDDQLEALDDPELLADDVDDDR
jgi:two-component system, NtrC family, nitrogen regulation response regulator NtrX